MTKRQRSGFLILLVIIGIQQLILWFPKDKMPVSGGRFTQEELLAIEVYNKNLKTKEQPVLDISKNFNPNLLDVDGFIQLGFTKRQAQNIINYRKACGGRFHSKEHFKKCYAITEDIYQKIRNYIDLPQQNRKFVATKLKEERVIKRPKAVFDPNDYKESDWIALGFNARDVQTIFNYKNALPNQKFWSVEQLERCYAFRDNEFEIIKPFVKFGKQIITQKVLPKNLNDWKLQNWLDNGVVEETARNIEKYTEFIKGFKSSADIENCKFIPLELKKELLAKVNAQELVFE